MVTISVADSVTAGAPLRFRISANPAPQADLTVTVTIAAPDCALAQLSAPMTTPVTIAAGKSHAMLEVPTSGAAAGADGCEVTATIAAGRGYAVGAAAGASATATVTMQPVVTVTADSASVAEGSPVAFTLAASPPPTVDLTVNVSWSDPGSFLEGTPSTTVTIPVSGTAPLTAATDDDSVDEPNGSVTVTVGAGSGYTVGSSGSATVAVTDDDGTTGSPGPSTSGPLSAVTIAIVGGSTTVTEGDSISFEVTATPAPTSTLTVSIRINDHGNHLATKPTSVDITTSGTATFTVTTANDDVVRGPYGRTIRVGIDGRPDTYTLGDPSVVTITVEDDDGV